MDLRCRWLQVSSQCSSSTTCPRREERSIRIHVQSQRPRGVAPAQGGCYASVAQFVAANAAAVPLAAERGRVKRAAAFAEFERPQTMFWSPVFAISIGAAAGALLRWQLGARMNSLFPILPLGTLAANLVGGYIIGLAVAYFAHATNIAPEWRLLIVTGFCGGLTTFSTFSAEVVTRLQEGHLGWAMGAIAIHVVGSLLMTLAGLATGHLLESL
jgi:fluoride exporter